MGLVHRSDFQGPSDWRRAGHRDRHNGFAAGASICTFEGKEHLGTADLRLPSSPDGASDRLDFKGVGMIQDLVQATTSVGPAGCDHPTAATWAARITERWRSSVEAIIATGRLLIEAKDALAHGAFGAMCETQLPFSASTAQRLMAVARDLRLSNPAHVQHLPASWGTLYELTKLSDDEFSSAIAQQVIRPDMLRGEAELIRPLTHKSSDGPREREGTPAALEAATHRIRRTYIGPLACGESPASLLPSETHMPSGGLAIAHNRVEPGNSLDFFPTPPWATRALFEHVFVHLGRKGHCQYQRAWEPACGKGHMAEPLTEYFREVHATDIADYGYGIYGVDFLDEHPEMGFDWI